MIDLSIIVPVYNAAETIEKTVASIQKQTFKNLEIILINDGSIDNSLEIIKRLVDRDKRITLINQKNSGVSSARNRGIAIARGRFIGFVDADDYIEPWYYETLMKHSEHSLVISDYIELDENNERKEINLDIEEGALQHPDIENLIIRKMFLGDGYRPETALMGTVWRIIVEKDLIINNNIRFKENIKIAEDLLFLIECMMTIKSLYVCKSLGYIYIRHPLTTLKRYRANCLEENELYIQILKELVNKTEILKNDSFKEYFDLSIIILYQRIVSNYFRKDAPNEVEVGTVNKICQSMNDYFTEGFPNIEYLDKKRKFIFYLMKRKKSRLIRLIYNWKR